MKTIVIITTTLFSLNASAYCAIANDYRCEQTQYLKQMSDAMQQQAQMQQRQQQQQFYNNLAAQNAQSQQQIGQALGTIIRKLIDLGKESNAAQAQELTIDQTIDGNIEQISRGH